MNEQDVLERLFALLQEYNGAQTEGRFLEYTSPRDLQQILELEQEGGEGDWERIFAWVEKYLQYGVKTGHPSFVNRMWAGANLPSMIGEMVVAMSNTSACTYESAPVSTLMEQYMIRQMLDLVGFQHGEGQMTTGSSNANMIAMMCARNLACAQVKQQGLFGSRRLYAFVNEEAHYSMDKAANILGIGIEQLVKVGVDESGRMDPGQLEEALYDVVQQGGVPFFVAATAGTTVRGAYDPIKPLLRLRQSYPFWLHVDGAWGGAVVMSERLRAQYMDGLDEVDSFTCDFHKMLGAALMCNILLVNNRPHTFGTVLAGGDGSYLFRNTDDNNVKDLGTVSLQCGRRVDSLKWFLDWKYYGRAGLGRRIESYLALCEYAERIVHETPELELVAPRDSFNICFRYRAPAEQVNGFNQELRTRLYQRGVNLVGIAFVGEVLVLRLLLTNTAVGRSDVDQFFQEVVATGRQMAAGESDGPSQPA